MSELTDNIKNILAQLSGNVELVAAVKTRSADEILHAAQAGIKTIGHNYVQEALSTYETVKDKVKIHLIGHLQKNKAKIAVEIFDLIETVDSLSLASEIDKQCKKINKVMPVLIEINSAKEDQKNGVFPEDAVNLIKEISLLKNIKIKGLMTMGPFLDDPEKIRPYFKKTRDLFNLIKDLNIANADMEYLSMGMSDSYKTAIEEGANQVRIGTLLFGKRN